MKHRKKKSDPSKDKLLLEEWLSMNKVTVLPQGKAEGATSHGSICAAPYGSSAIGRHIGKARIAEDHRKNNPPSNFKEPDHNKEVSKARKARNHHKKLAKRMKGNPATEKQKAFMRELGIHFSADCSKRKAFNMIAHVMRASKEFRQKAEAHLRSIQKETI